MTNIDVLDRVEDEKDSLPCSRYGKPSSIPKKTNDSTKDFWTANQKLKPSDVGVEKSTPATIKSVGFVSAKEIHDLKCKNCETRFKNCGTNGYLSCCPECDHFKKQYLDCELFVWRCELYKKYTTPLNVQLFKQDYPKEYNAYVLDRLSFPFWFFDFVMNGNMDGEKNE